jgi:sec-independent protein translocase protein TatA
MIGFTEIALIVIVILIVFGAGKLPSVMGDLAKGVNAFKRGLKDDGTDKKDETKSDV